MLVPTCVQGAAIVNFLIRDCLISRFGAGGSYRQFFDSLIKFENEDVCDGIAEVRHSREILHLHSRNTDVDAMIND